MRQQQLLDFLDCGGKRSATPISQTDWRAKAVSPLRSATAVHMR